MLTHSSPGFGAGTHSAHSIGGGCASRVSDRVSVNAALATESAATRVIRMTIFRRVPVLTELGKIDDSPKIAARQQIAIRWLKLEERNESSCRASNDFTLRKA